MIKSLLLLIVAVSILALGSPVFAHNYFAPYLYMSGIYSPGEYAPASDAEMEYLLEQIKSPDRNTRAVAAGALGQANNPKAVEPLLQVLNDKSPGVVMNASLAFFHVKDKRAIEPLKKMLFNHEAGLGSLGASYSISVQGDEGIDALMEASAATGDDQGNYARSIVAEALLLSQGPGTAAWASDVLKGPKKKYHPIAISILEHLCYSSEERIKDVIREPAITDVLISVASDENNVSRDAALILLEDSKDPRVKPLLEAREKVREEEEEYYREEDTEPWDLDDKTIKQYAAEIRKAKGNIGDIDCLDAREVASRLANTTNPAGTQTLLKILNEKNATAACIAADAMAYSKDPEAIEAIAAVLEKPEHPAYKEVVTITAHIGKPAVIIKLLQSEDDFTVREAITSIEPDDDRSLIQYLIPHLDNPKFKLYAALALAGYRDPAAINTLIDYLRDQKTLEDRISYRVMSALMDYGLPAVEKVLPKLSDPDPKMKTMAISFFTYTKEPRAVDALITALSDTDAKLRRQAIKALIFQGDSRACSHYIKALEDTDSVVRKHACYAVALSPDESATKALAALLGDKDRYTRACAAVALGQLGDNRGADLVVELCKPVEQDGSDWDPSALYVPAIRAVGKLKDNRATGALINSLMFDVSMSVFDGVTKEELDASRTAKLDALKSITGQDFGFAFYRWMAWWVAQGNEPVELLPGQESSDYDLPEYEEE